MANTQEEIRILRELRKRIFIAAYRGGYANLASCFSSLEIFYALYNKGVMNIDKSNPDFQDRDRFVLSKGHAALALYACFVDLGLMSPKTFYSYLQGDGGVGIAPNKKDSKWVDFNCGSLGHGLSAAAGMAMAFKMDDSKANVYVMVGDGECQEGSVYEAAMSAAAFGLDNLKLIIDCNRIQKMDFISEISEQINFKTVWSSLGWSVDEVDGHDTGELYDALKKPNPKGKPKLIVANTVKGKGVSIMENEPKWHFRLPNKKELEIFKDELGIDESELLMGD